MSWCVPVLRYFAFWILLDESLYYGKYSSLPEIMLPKFWHDLSFLQLSFHNIQFLIRLSSSPPITSQHLFMWLTNFFLLLPFPHHLFLLLILLFLLLSLFPHFILLHPPDISSFPPFVFTFPLILSLSPHYSSSSSGHFFISSFWFYVSSCFFSSPTLFFFILGTFLHFLL